MTPEGKVKAEVKKVLDAYGSSVYYEMNVPGGYGKSGLDFIGIFMGAGFAIETKKAKKDLSSRQEGVRDDIIAAGGKVFVIIGEGACGPLIDWMERIKSKHESFRRALEQSQR